MSSLSRSMERSIIRKKAEDEAAPKRAKLRAKRKKHTDELPIERNVILFKKAWSKYHYPSVEIKDKDGNITTVKKRKPIKRKQQHLSGKALVSRMQYEKSLREQIAEKFREMRAKRKAEAEEKKKAKQEAKEQKQKMKEQKTEKE